MITPTPPAPLTGKADQQLHAQIKRNSKYFGQGEKGEIFPVYLVTPNFADDYIVMGGPGGRYRLKDVALFVSAGNAWIKLS